MTAGVLRAVFVALVALAAVACLAAAARMPRPADRRTLVSLGATLGACAAVTLGREVAAASWSGLLDALGVGIVAALAAWLLRGRRRP